MASCITRHNGGAPARDFGIFAGQLVPDYQKCTARDRYRQYDLLKEPQDTAKAEMLQSSHY
jgi:hypothetical protein